MTREEALNKAIIIISYFEAHFAKSKEAREDAVNIIEALEQEPKTGHWIFDDECKEHGHCSRCGYGRVDLVDGEPHNYCPNCGAKMQEVEENG